MPKEPPWHSERMYVFLLLTTFLTSFDQINCSQNTTRLPNVNNVRHPYHSSNNHQPVEQFETRFTDNIDRTQNSTPSVIVSTSSSQPPQILNANTGTQGNTLTSNKTYTQEYDVKSDLGNENGNDHNESEEDDDHKSTLIRREHLHTEGVQLFPVHFEHVKYPLVFTLVVILAGLSKIAFHQAHAVSSKVPESW